VIAAEVIVIGGGIAGAGAAYELAADVKVLLLEREGQCGYHATGRSAASFTENYGTATIRKLAGASRAFFENPPDGFCEHPLVRPRGMITIARADQAEALDLELDRARKFVASIVRIGPEKAISLVPALRRSYLADAIFEPDSRDIDVHGLHQGFLKGIRRRGGRIEADREVGRIRREGSGWAIETRDEHYEAPIIVNAAGAWADEIAATAGLRPLGLVAKRRSAFVVDPPEGLAIDAWPLVNDVGQSFYFKPDAGRLLVSPADAEPSPPTDAQPDEEEVALGVDRLQRATSIPVRRILRKWAGLRTFAADGGPVVGEDPEARGFFWLAGQGGYGIKTAPILSKTIAALALGKGLPPEAIARGLTEAELSPSRFAPANA